jgi:PAS domain S-box-containing protein
MSLTDEVRVADTFASEVVAHFGVLPNFFCSAPAAPGLIEELWAFAKAAYLESPLPSLFKERLFVHLSRFCLVRYCIVRHVGFLIGEGRPAGDPSVPAQTVEQALALLRRPIPDEATLDRIFARLGRDGLGQLPPPETREEADLFDALTIIFLAPNRSARARHAVRRAVGDKDFELLIAFLAFVRTAHYWTETHPELAYEPDMIACMERYPELARLLMNAREAEEVSGEAARSRTEAALRGSEEQQHLTLQLVPALLWWTDPSGRLISPNEQWKLYTGQRRADTRDFGWLDAIHPDDVEATRAAFERAFATGEPLQRQLRIRQAVNGYRWHLVRQVPVRDESGTITRWFGAAIDVHELRELHERQEVLVAELQHRTRNLMGVVRSMADKTMARSTDLLDFRARYNDGLAALARVQNLLSRIVEGERITFDDLIRSEMAALDGSAEKVTLEGPKSVALPSTAVQIFALALHELATNAVKYGAFSQPRGRLDVRWRLDRALDDSPWLHVDWREHGVAAPSKNASPGSGRELIERALPYQLGARTTYVMEEDGVHCTISLPVSEWQELGDKANA